MIGVGEISPCEIVALFVRRPSARWEWGRL